MHAVQKLAKDLTNATSTPSGYLAYVFFTTVLVLFVHFDILRGTYLATSDQERMRQEALKIKSVLVSHIKADARIGEIDGSDRFLWEMSKNYTMADIKSIIGDSPL